MQINPRYNTQINPQYNARINPQYNTQVNPRYNARINPRCHLSINPIFSPSINIHFNPIINPQINPSINPVLAPTINPNFRIGETIALVFGLNNRMEMFGVPFPQNATNKGYLLFSEDCELKSYAVSNSEAGFNVYDHDLTWIAYWVRMDKGYLCYSLQDDWKNYIII